MRGSALEALRRSYLNLTRGVIMSTDDSKAVQTVSVRLMQDEQNEAIERFQQYGFHSVPKSPDNNGENGAEALVGFVHGNRSHPVVLADLDRRTRPTNWNEGDAGTWHYSGATARFTDQGFVHDQGSMKQPLNWTVGNLTVTWADGTATIKVGGTSVVVTDGKIALGDASASIPVMLETGPSSLVFATK